MICLKSVTIFLALCHYCLGYFSVSIVDDGPIVQGATITFKAQVYSSGVPSSTSFRFSWSDNGFPRHTFVDDSSNSSSTWQVTYPSGVYYPGEYEVEVKVDRFYVFEVVSGRKFFNVTGTLNGNMKLKQNNTERANFVANGQQVQHEISLSSPDSAFIAKNATQITTYWFVDCVLYEQSEDFKFNNTYSKTDVEHYVEALVVGSFDPITTVAPSTTSTTSTTATPPTTSTAVPSSTTLASTTLPSSNSSTRYLNGNMNGSASNNLTIQEIIQTIKFGKLLPESLLKTPYVCLNTSIIPPDPNKTYGYFQHRFTVKAPIANISIIGTTWIQPSEILKLQVNCEGSGKFELCSFVAPAGYNVTNNETCYDPDILDFCQLNFTRLYGWSNYTVVVVMSNDISKVVYPIAITLYKVQRHAQLSVIIVPVACCAVAVILIVFGVAYYIQSRRRFIVEVADFDFGQEGGEMEYKTFKERLMEAMSNSINRTEEDDDYDMRRESNTWSPSKKYGSMQ